MSKEITYIRYYFVVFVIGLACLFGLSLFMYIYSEHESATQFAIVEAKASFNKDILYRRWVAMHGGVYVPITAQTQPNPYLKNIKERDIETPSGKKLTLINPAYMTRQVFETETYESGVKGHITSLNPIRFENKADGWETKALQMFNSGVVDYFGIDTLKSKSYLRYMKAMKVEQSCLKCHEAQGYKLGDIRGGISVSVPMQSYLDISYSHIKIIVLSHLLIF